MTDFIKIGQKKDFPVNQVTGVKVDGGSIAITHMNGQFSAFEDSCSHAESKLSGCRIEEGKVTCPLHGAQFNALTGAAQTLPATEPLKKFDIKIKNDDVYIKI